jgi:long-chain acyl-CoA synthetase
VTAILVPDLANLESHAQAAGWSLDAPDGFLRAPEMLAFYQQRVDAVMQAVSNPERVKRFLLLARPFQVADEELTATFKVRRRHILSKYAAQIDQLYRGDAPAAAAVEGP